MGDYASLNHGIRRRLQTSLKLDKDYMYVHGCNSNVEGLHKNCKGCPHIVEKKCKYIRFPKQRKWPCYFKDNNTG